jgi:hypothetical protein
MPTVVFSLQYDGFTVGTQRHPFCLPAPPAGRLFGFPALARILLYSISGRFVRELEERIRESKPLTPLLRVLLTKWGEP